MLALGLTHLGTQQGFGVRPITSRELTAAILLVIKSIFLEQLVATLLQATLAPVLRPEVNILRVCIDCFLSCEPSTVNLFQTLPTAGGQRGGEIRNAEFLCLTGCRRQTHKEALLTAMSTLRFTLKSLDTATPRGVVVVAINPLNAQRLSVAFTLVLADVILLARPDIGIVIENRGAHTIGQQPLDNG